ncbi:unnamed protein product [Dibothriocephalus latus]|uniref:USP domain-containing protein n=1 Tax=Dibothriocephalus latus TaxID=60516 RepID=A0A3P7M401_DIBLA|nr:unnamed protein product [Dibothriocephalus latus]
MPNSLSVMGYASDALFYYLTEPFSWLLALASFVTPKEILTVWLHTSVGVSELLRNTCWISASSSVGLLSADTVNLPTLHSAILTRAKSVQKPEGVQQREQQQQYPKLEPATAALSSSSVSTTGTSVGYDAENGSSSSSSSSPGNGACSLSLASSLGSPPVQDFLQGGHIDQTALLPFADALAECPEPTSQQDKNNLLPFLRCLALHSGRTPGCLAVEALEALKSAVTLSLDNGLFQMLPPAFDQEPAASSHCTPSLSSLSTADTEALSPANERASALRSWLIFLFDLLFVCPATYLRIAAREFVSLTVTRSLVANCSLIGLCELSGVEERKQPWSSLAADPVNYMINFLITTMVEKGDEFRDNTSECTDVIVKLLEFMWHEQLPVSVADELLTKECSWLLKANCLLSSVVHNLFTTIILLNPDPCLHTLLFETCIFPASKRLRQLRKSLQSKSGVSAVILESTNLYVCPDDVLEAAFDFVRELVNCAPANALSLNSILMELLYSQGPGFVGLQNGGSTCYMNSVLQQLFAITPIRDAILAVPVGKILEAANSAAAKAALPSFSALGDGSQPEEDAQVRLFWFSCFYSHLAEVYHNLLLFRSTHKSEYASYRKQFGSRRSDRWNKNFIFLTFRILSRILNYR